jgi:hypothetical protein
VLIANSETEQVRWAAHQFFSCEQKNPIIRQVYVKNDMLVLQFSSMVSAWDLSGPLEWPERGYSTYHYDDVDTINHVLIHGRDIIICKKYESDVQGLDCNLVLLRMPDKGSANGTIL